MKTKTPATLLYSAFIFFIVASSSSDDCNPSSCSKISGPEIRFPFRLTGRKPDRCGSPGFNLSCNHHGKTILTLPSTQATFLVNNIDYNSQIIQISDPENCLPDKILNISLTGSPFRAPDDTRFAILRCPPELIFENGLLPCPCRRNLSKSVVAVPVPTRFLFLPSPICEIVAENVSIPIRMNRDYPVFLDVVNRVELSWDKPDCRDCGNRDKLCGLEIGCSNPPLSSKGIPRVGMYGIIIGVTIGPSLLCIFGLVYWGYGKIKKIGLINSHENHPTELPIITIMELPPMPTNGTGLDPLTIQSYPKIVLGENWQLPKPNDNTCPICLSEYQPEETLRSIPECNHYFHANCIDEWLGLNATCPLCRKSPDKLENASQSLSI